MFYLSREFEQRDSHSYSQMDGRWNCKAVVKTTAWATMSGRAREEGVGRLGDRQAGRQEKVLEENDSMTSEQQNTGLAPKQPGPVL